MKHEHKKLLHKHVDQVLSHAKWYEYGRQHKWDQRDGYRVERTLIGLCGHKGLDAVFFDKKADDTVPVFTTNPFQVTCEYCINHKDFSMWVLNTTELV